MAFRKYVFKITEAVNFIDFIVQRTNDEKKIECYYRNTIKTEKLSLQIFLFRAFRCLSEKGRKLH